MSESWEIVQHSWREIGIYSFTRLITMIDVENLFDVSEDNQDECEQRALINAQLIAAAPELLEALERFIAWVDKQNLEYESAMVRQAKAAIAKAKGESNGN